VNAYFESSAEYWKEIYSDDKLLLPTIYQERHNTTLDWIWNLGLPTVSRILEVGCGAGLVTINLAQSGHTVDAMDSTAAMLQIARSGALHQGVRERIRLHLADVHALPFETQTFDLVIAIGVIPWLHSERVALLEMHRVLKYGGYLLVTADNNARLNRILDPLSNPIFTPLRAAAKGLLRLCGKWPPKSGFQPKRHYPRELHHMLGSCNFINIKSRTVGFGPFTLLGKELLGDRVGVKLHRQLQRLAAEKSFSPLRWTGSHHLVLAAKAKI